MTNRIARIHISLAIELIFFALLVTGVIPRQAALYAAAGMTAFVLFATLKDATVFFISSIPLFVALPLTSTFDNFNTWRILSIVIFLRWLLNRGTLTMLYGHLRSFLKHPAVFLSEHWVVSSLGVTTLMALLSLLVAHDISAGLRRVVYFVNLSLIGIVVFSLVKQDQKTGERFAQAFMFPAVVAIAVGLIQVVSTYFIDIYQFMRIWGEGIQLRQYGSAWSYIVSWVGNTWFAYFGDQLSLRVFSLFPDSHTFPIFLLFALPALFAIGIGRIETVKDKTLKTMLRTRGSLSVVWIPLAFLMLILSGTRGIWAASIAAVLFAILICSLMRRSRAPAHKRSLFSYMALYLVLFFLLFAVAYPIFVSPQFLLSKGDLGLLSNRIRSILDFGETSNHRRLEIWKTSLESIARHPLTGVGIGNFPLVLGENISRAKAGSSAHNLYLHIAAEIGLVGLITAIWFLASLTKRTYENYLHTTGGPMTVYFGALLITLPWILAYLLTDAALFDERAFLAFAITAGIVIGYHQKTTP